MSAPREGVEMATSAPRETIELTIFPSCRNPNGRCVQTTWDELAARFATPTIAPTKDSLSGWSPAAFAQNHRALANVERVYALGLDLDDGPEREELEQRIRAAGLRAIVHSTWHHLQPKDKHPASPRWRVLAQPSRPISGDEYEPVLRAFAATLGVAFDEGAKDASRFWFIPAIQEGAPYEAFSIAGERIDVDSVLAALPPKPVPAPRAAPMSTGNGYVRGALARAAEVLQAAPQGTRNTTAAKEAFSIGGLVGIDDLTEDHAADVLIAAAVAAGWPTRHHDTIRRAVAAGTQKPREIPMRNAAYRHSPANDAPPAKKPTIKIAAGELGRIIPEAVEALADGDDNIYQSALQLISIAREPEGPYERSVRRGLDVTLRPGTPRMHELDTVLVTEHLANAANFVKWDPRKGEKGEEGKRGEWVPTDPPSKVAAIVAARKNWPGIRPLRGIIEAPAMRPDGSIIEAPGYDDATGLLFLPSCEFPKVPDQPTQQQARDALRRLWIETACDFPFRGLGESDSATDSDRLARFERACECPDAFIGIAALLSQLARAAIRGAVPGFVFEATTQGSGKTHQMNVVATVATGRAASVMTFPTSKGEPNEEELEKVCASFALSGVPFIAFDNIKGQLGGAALEKVLTAEDRISLRVLGETKEKSIAWLSIVLFSGNNMTLSDDSAQRTLISRLESTHEDPRKRPPEDFRHPDLLAAMRELRPQLLCDALTVLRAFMIADKEMKATTRRESGAIGSFFAWSAIVPAAIRYAGGPRIVDARCEVGGMGQDAESEAHATLMSRWLWGDAPVKAADILHTLFPGGWQQVPDGNDELRAAVRTLCRTPENLTPNAYRFGLKLKALRGKWRDGMKLHGEADRKGIVLWTRVGRPQTAPTNGRSAQPANDAPPYDISAADIALALDAARQGKLAPADLARILAAADPDEVARQAMSEPSYN